MTFKEKVYAHGYALLEEKINALRVILSELEAGSENDSKSSAGDKHETARAMMQLEQEKISKQLKEMLEQKSEFEKIATAPYSKEIKKGSLVKTNRGYLFFSIPLGRAVFDGVTIMFISTHSPLAAQLVGLSKGSEAIFNNIPYRVDEIE